MQRRRIIGGEIRIIGKETKNIEEQPLELGKTTEYHSRKNVTKKVLKMSSKEALEKGVPKQTLSDMKKRLRKNTKKFNWKTKAARKLLR